MKYCRNCQKTYDTEDDVCPVCETALIEIPQDECDELKEQEDAEIIATMMITGIL